MNNCQLSMTGPGFRVDVISNKYVNSPKSNVMSAAQKQLARGVLKENMQQMYRRTSMPKCDFNSNFIEIKLRQGCSTVNLLHIFRTPFFKNRQLLLAAAHYMNIKFLLRIFVFLD